MLELHGDEWLPMVAMHSRWNVPENAAFARTEFARCAVPWLPRALGRPLVGSIADRMAGYLPLLGVTRATQPGIEAFAHDLIRQLDAHLAAHRFLLGGRPCLGDFALFGPLWAHTFRDPGSAHWFDDAPHVRRWFDDLLAPRTDPPGAFLPDDQVPETLDPVFHTLFREQWPTVVRLFAAIDAYCDANPGCTRVPRALGDLDFVIGSHAGTRRMLTFTAWMAQRPLRAYAATGDAADPWLRRVGGWSALQQPVRNPQERRGFAMGLAPA